MTVSVQAKDQYGNHLSTGGANVLISLSGTGTLSATTDNGDGTYTATLSVPTTVGSGSLTATIGGVAVEGNTGSPQTVTVEYSAAAPNKFVITGSGTQIAGSSQDLTITAKDQYGNTVSAFGGDKSLTFSGPSAAPGGTTPFVTDKDGVSVAIGTAGTFTFSNGVASVSGGANGAITLYAAEVVALSVTGEGISSASFGDLSMTVSPAALSTFEVTNTSGGAIGSQTAGTSFDVKIRAVDTYGNTQTSFTGTVDLTSTSTFSAGGGTTPALTAGVLASRSVTLTTSGAVQTITATRTSGGAEAGTSNPFTVAPGGASAATSTLVATSSSLVADGSSSTTITVTLKDANGNLITADVAAITLSATSGTLSSVSYAGNGQYTATLTSSTTAGTSTITGTLDAQAMTASDTVSFVAGAPTKILVVTAPVAAASGSQFSTQPVVRITDVNNNTVTSSSASVTVSAGSGTLSGTTSLTASAGVVTFAGLSFAGLTTSSHTLTFSSLNLTSATVSVTPTGAGPAASIAVNAGDGQTATMSATLPIAPSVIVRDSAGNSVAGVSVTFTAVAGSLGAPGSPAVVTTDANGVATSPVWTLGTTIGANQLTAASTGLSGSPVTFTATGTTRSITITADDESITYGTNLSPSFTRTGDLGGADAISGVTYTYTGTGSTTYGPSTTAPTGAGTYSVTPSTASFSPGSASNYSITYVPGSVTIAKASQTITFTNPAPSGATYGDAPIPVSPSSDSGLVVTLTPTDTSVCTVSGGGVNLVRAGNCVITASQAGDANFLAAADVVRSFTIAKANQATVTMTSPSTAIFGETITLAAAGGSGTGQLVFGVEAGSCTIANSTTLTLGNVGSLCQVSATKSTDANFNATTSATQTITITQAGQTLAFTSTVPSSPVSGGTYTPSATAVSTVTGASSGVVPTFAVAGSCSLAGGVVTFTASGNCTVTASAGSNSNFTAATDVFQVIVVGSINQNITFAQPTNKSFGSSAFSLGATASSSLTVTYTLGAGTTNSACSVSSLGVVTILAVGTCEVVASQAGDAQYAAASSVTRAFQVVPALATAPTLTSASPGSQAITVAFTAPGFTGGVSISAYRVVATPTGAGTTVVDTSCTGSPCTISGLVNGTEYRVTVAAINVAGTGPASGATGPLTPATAAFAVGALSAVPGDTVVDLSWTALTNPQLGGGTFTRYEVSYRAAGVTPTPAWTLATAALTTQSTNSYQVIGLDNGTSYDFQVVAFTSANASEIAGNTAQVVQYPSTAPGAPQSLSVLASTATDVLFSWSAPLSDGGSILVAPYYAVTVSSTTPAATTPITCTITGTDTFCSVSGLTNGAVYTFEVAAINRMGVGTIASETYNVPSSDSSLSNLEIAVDGTPLVLDPAFATGTTTYSATVPNSVSSIDVAATSTMQSSTVTVTKRISPQGLALAAQNVWVMATTSAIALSVGANVIDIDVTASDPRFSTTYTVTVTRAPAPTPAVIGIGGGGPSADPLPKTPGPGRNLPDPDTEQGRPDTPVTIDPITAEPPEGDDWDTETMRIVDPVTNDESTVVVTPDGTWTLDTNSGLVNFMPVKGFYGRAEVEFVITTRKGVAYRALLSVYVAPLGPMIPITGTESTTPLVWALWLVVAGILSGALARRRGLFRP
ncbi:MAG: invasin domain 3-containing protein [Ilumatobacteraceae bacterium]